MTAANRPVILAETGDSYEIGVKSELFGNTVFNAAAFWAKYKNFQSNVPAVLNGTVITTITNVGDITTGGVEVEFRTRVTDALNVSGGFAYDEARFDALGPNTITTAPAKVGSALPFAPKFKGSLSADYTLRFGGFSVVPSVTYSWQSASFSGLNEPAAQRIKGYGLLDAQIAVTDANERFRIALVGHNMLDDSYTARIEPGGGNLGNAFLYQLPRDVSRYWSVQARYNFGGK
jgi:iron complex outermembrane receptor protein